MLIPHFIKFFRILLLITVVSSFMSFSTNDCNILKNNTFVYRKAKKDVIVTFKEDTHVEYHNNKQFYIKSDILWVSDCEYYLVIRESTLPNFPFKAGTKMHINVDKVKGSKIYYTSTLRGQSWSGKMTKVD